MSTIETMVRCHVVFCLLTEWSHHCILIFLRYQPLTPPLLLGRYLLPAPVPPPFLHQQSARALQHLVSPHDLRRTPWHKSVRTLVARPFQISLSLFQTSYIVLARRCI